jgi:hypothetical protein
MAGILRTLAFGSRIVKWDVCRLQYTYKPE